MKTIWPSGDYKGILTIKESFNTLFKRHNLEYIFDMDDLGKYCASVMYIDTIGPILLMEYQNQPIPGLTIYADSDVNIELAVSKIRAKFQLTDLQITWTSSTAN